MGVVGHVAVAPRAMIERPKASGKQECPPAGSHLDDAIAPISDQRIPQLIVDHSRAHLDPLPWQANRANDGHAIVWISDGRANDLHAAAGTPLDLMRDSITLLTFRSGSGWGFMPSVPR